MKHKFIFIYLLLFCVATSISGQQKSLNAEIIKSIEKRIATGFNPSIAIALIDSSGTHFFNFGKTKRNGLLVDEHTLYEIGSVTKVFTAILLAKQSSDEDLSIDDKINAYLPDSIKVPVRGTQEITLGHLSDHTSGLPRLPGNMKPANPYNPYADYKLNQLYAFISTYTPTREVGTAYEYSNLAVGLLGHILALNKGISYEELVKQDIIVPLQMTETSITLADDLKEKLATGHASGFQVPNWDFPTLAGAGALKSSTADLAHFISANLGYEKSELFSVMVQTHKERHQKGGVSVGLGWHISDGSYGDIISHNGGTGGYRSFIGFVKETGKGAVVMTNSTESIDDIGFKLLDPNYNLKAILSKEDAVEVDEHILEHYVGVYELTPSLMLTISKEGQKLFAQATGQMKFEIFAESDTSFFPTIIPAKIIFQAESDKVNSLTLFQGGQRLVGKKME